MYKTKKQIDVLVEKQQLLKIPMWNNKIEIKRYNELGNKAKLDIVYSNKYKTYAIIETIKPYTILFYMVRKTDIQTTIKNLNKFYETIKGLF